MSDEGVAPRRMRYLVAHPGAEMFGSDRMALESIRGMRGAGADVLVALPEDGPLAHVLAEEGVRVVFIPMLVLRKSLLRPRNWLSTMRLGLRGAVAAWRLMRRHRPDAVYVSTATLPQWPVMAFARRVPTIAHIHEAEGATRVRNAALYAPLVFAHRIVVNSRFTGETMRRSMPWAARDIDVVYNGVAGPSQTTPPRATIDELRVLYVGRLSPRKGVDVLLDGAALLQRGGQAVRVSVLGSVFRGYEWYEAELRSRANRADSAPTEFLGYRADIWPSLAENDVLVVPSREDESFGNTAIEGILARRPVVTSDQSGLREAVGAYSTASLISPNDARSLASALAEVASQWMTLRQNVEFDARRASDRHDPDIYRARIARIMSSVAHR